MRRAANLLVLGLFLVAGSARADFSLISPGPLSSPHADLESKCDKCHVPFKGVPDSACLACHKRTAENIKLGHQPHAGYQRDGKKCASCHDDHRGVDHRITPPLPPTEKIDHDKVGFALEGAHGSVSCAGCHTQTARGQKWNLSKDCAGCHKDQHKGTLGTKCASCHSTSFWRPTTHPLGAHTTQMVGGHSHIACVTCHSKGTGMVAKSRCDDCHSQPHGGTKAPCDKCHRVENWKRATFQHDFCDCFLSGKHQTATCLACHPGYKFTPTPMACAGCHEKDRKHEDLGACSRCHSPLSWKKAKIDHDKVGFQLTGHHLEAGCDNCHKDRSNFKAAPTACEGCHKTPKHGDFGACAKCHTTAGFAPSSFAHEKTRYPLDVTHAKVACENCHGKFKAGQFDPENSCIACHKDPHDNQFGEASPTGKLERGGGFAIGFHAGGKGKKCVDCHRGDSWKPSTVSVADHATYKMALNGAHKTVACDSCHAGGKFAGTPADCASCHIDRHQGRFGRECTKCHSENGWKDHGPFDHQGVTGFALEGSHADRRCPDCHGENGRKLAGLHGRIDCATCHTAKHGDRFGRACESCHTITKFSDVKPFNHDTTQFPLERRHKAVACVNCHSTARPRISPDCRSCHADPHQGRTLLDCSQCHQPDNWTLVRYDHDTAEFPLKGRHFLTPCRLCHVNEMYTGLRRECVFCHRGDRQRADIKLPGHNLVSWDCIECHRPFGW